MTRVINTPPQQPQSVSASTSPNTQYQYYQYQQQSSPIQQQQQQQQATPAATPTVMQMAQNQPSHPAHYNTPLNSTIHNQYTIKAQLVCHLHHHL